MASDERVSAERLAALVWSTGLWQNMPERRSPSYWIDMGNALRELQARRAADEGQGEDGWDEFILPPPVVEETGAEYWPCGACGGSGRAHCEDCGEPRAIAYDSAGGSWRCETCLAAETWRLR